MFKKNRTQDVDMAFWWKKSPRTPSDYVKSIKEQLVKLHTITHSPTTNGSSDTKKKVQEECSKYLMGLKNFILNESEPKPTNELMNELYTSILKHDLFYDLVNDLIDLEFEAKKEVILIYSIALRYSNDNKLVTVDYLVSKPQTIKLTLIKIESCLSSKDYQDAFLMLGNMILESLKYEQLCRIILKDEQFWKFFEFAKLNNFEISTESLQVLNAALTTHSKLVSTEFFNGIESNGDSNNTNQILNNNIPRFIQNINKLMLGGTYVIKRQSTKLLTTLIIDCGFKLLMLEYINSPDNLKLIMTLLTDRSKNLQLEAFNIFKVIIANPRKKKPVLDILIKNREKLLKYLETFNNDYNDLTFFDERTFVIQGIESLPRLVPNNPPITSNDDALTSQII